MQRAGCGGLAELPEGRGEDQALPAIKCGKAAVNADETRLFLRFLAK
jgi:hypothetical protein